MGDPDLEIDGRVLPGRHAACILVERVEKPTDNRPARLLCYRAADDSRRSDQPRVGPRRISQYPPRAWARGYFDETHRSRAEGGTGRRNKTPFPLRGLREGEPRSRADVITAHSHTQ